MKIFFITLLCLMILIIGIYIIFNERRPSNLGVHDGALAACPSRPNCVSSQSNDQEHAIPPLSYDGEKNPITILARIVRKYPKTRIITENENYMHVEFRSDLFSFVDDTEFFYDKANGVIHIRSAARMGYSDLGVNRHRALEIEKSFKAKTESEASSTP